MYFFQRALPTLPLSVIPTKCIVMSSNWFFNPTKPLLPRKLATGSFSDNLLHSINISLHSTGWHGFFYKVRNPNQLKTCSAWVLVAGTQRNCLNWILRCYFEWKLKIVKWHYTLEFSNYDNFKKEQLIILSPQIWFFLGLPINCDYFSLPSEYEKMAYRLIGNYHGRESHQSS